MVTPRQAIADAKAGDRHSLLSTGGEGSDQPVARGAQHAVDTLDELLLAFIRGSQRAHRLMSEVRLARGQLVDLDRAGVHGAHPALSSWPLGTDPAALLVTAEATSEAV